MTTSPNDNASLLARIAQTTRPNLVVTIGYGDELPVFRHARALWQFYMCHFPGIEVIFVRWSDKLKRGEVMSDGHDLLVGIGGDFQGAAGYNTSGVWSQSENARWIYRQVLVQDYLLRTRDAPFFLYQTTITSVVDFRGLCTVLDHIAPENCFAGPVGRLNAPEAFAGLTFISGASALMSRDVLVRMRERYDPSHVYASLPNDIWQAAVLHDVPRQALPTFNFVRPRAPRADASYLYALATQLLQQGQYHFRIKTVAPEDAAGRREDIDPWIMLRIMEAILDSEHTPAATLTMIDKVRRLTDGGAGGPIEPRRAAPVHIGPRDFAMNDGELA
ncbi:hypothetical protein SAMN05192549_103378 [Duganella sacchari]|uniref:Uncharacterized protein n=1 Tax=Duganella sacchari TaxID=551987 RepID=A0A1M7MY99_9BURK|nr:hypothetical protein [Duganella sacchari]SHM96011.1 hypothetical protein SAMN05192549_103378 [Duganella sacchari]